MKHFKILMASDIYYPILGGISEHIKHLCNELVQRGHTLHILTSGYDKDDYPEYKDPPCVKRVGWGISIPTNKSISNIALSPRISKRIKEYLEEEKFDIVHTHGPLAPVIPLFTLRHSSSLNFATFHAAHDEKTGYKVFETYLKKIFDKIHGPIAVSTVAMDTMARHFPGKYRIIPNGVDTGRFSPSVEPLSEFKDKKNILFLGRIEPRKGLKYLIKAFDKICKMRNDVNLLIVGKGGFKSYHKMRVSRKTRENMHFLGPAPLEMVPRYFATSDIFCSPAIGYESFGIVLLEAQATGKPVVASDIPGYRCVLKEDDDALLFPPKDVDALVHKLLLLLDNPDLCKKMGEKGRSKVEELYSWCKIAKEVEDYYYEIAELFGAF